MAISDTLTAIKQNLQAAYNKLQDKGATIPTNKNMENLASTIETVSSGVEEVATASAMNAKLVEENVGKYYKFTGTTDSNYTNGDLYLVESGT